MKYTYRDRVFPQDLETVRQIVQSTGFFTDEEVEVAVDLADAGLSGESISSYLFVFCQDEDAKVLGYTCYGPVPCTVGSFDLYWIAVHRDSQGQGIGKELLRRTEKKIRAMDGRRIYIETSSRDLYKPTQGFYLNAGYHAEATLKDYYSRGDSKIIYVKHLP
jgi:ribosomal protein S18 acetylase RimI-like enzyme